MENLFCKLPATLPDELITTLAESKHVRIERIVSRGHSSPKDFWYDQPEHEWLVVLRGEAELLLDGIAQPRRLKPGDTLLIPAHQKHRVQWTTPDEHTIWLAVFYHV